MTSPPDDAQVVESSAGGNAQPDGGNDGPGGGRGGSGGMGGGGGVATDGCAATAELCDGLDNNCDGHVDEGAVCPAGCVGLARQGGGYMFCFGDSVLRTWPQAQADCIAHGMHLVRVDDAAENRWINESAVAQNFLQQIWLGGRYITAVAQWEWTDGTPFWTSGPRGQAVNGLFAEWRNGEPQNNGGDACTDKYFGNTEVWEDQDCSQPFGYFCER